MIKEILQKQIVSEGLKYLVVGGLCTLIDFILLYVLSDILLINYVFSSILSFSVAVIINYYLSTFWIFKVRAINSKSLEFFSYLVISIIGLIINSGLIYLLTENQVSTYMISKVLATPIVLMWNFFARKYFLHTDKLNPHQNE
jgi:putative flippase GtrA